VGSPLCGPLSSYTSVGFLEITIKFSCQVLHVGFRVAQFDPRFVQLHFRSFKLIFQCCVIEKLPEIVTEIWFLFKKMLYST
jgi:hypothetical protein